MLFVIEFVRWRLEGVREGIVAEDRGRPLVCAQHDGGRVVVVGEKKGGDEGISKQWWL